jgi:hypothetical protein
LPLRGRKASPIDPRRYASWAISPVPGEATKSANPGLDLMAAMFACRSRRLKAQRSRLRRGAPKSAALTRLDR